MSKVHVGRSDGGRWVEELDRKKLGHTDLGKKERSLGHVAGFQKDPWQEKKKNVGITDRGSGCWVIQWVI